MYKRQGHGRLAAGLGQGAAHPAGVSAVLDGHARAAPGPGLFADGFRGGAPVSYTHLDVYKRQVLGVGFLHEL